MKKSKCPHSFAILAYKESPFLESCIHSLQEQTIKSELFLSTSTPSIFLDNISRKYNIPIYVNENKSGIASDWTFAYNTAKTTFVTLAHQDDIYLPNYTEFCLRTVQNKNSLIAFSDYVERVKGRIRKNTLLLLVKRFMLTSFFPFTCTINSYFLKKLLISIGNPISCPTIMYNKEKIGDFIFNPELSMNLDWEASFRLSEMQGDFVYVKKKLMTRRIHGDSETTKTLLSRRRHYEDKLLFEKMWPESVAKIILKLYSLGYKSNN